VSGVSIPSPTCHFPIRREPNSGAELYRIRTPYHFIYANRAAAVVKITASESEGFREELMNAMVWVRVIVGAVWLNAGLEKLLNPSFPRQFADSLAAGGFVSQAPPFFQTFMINNVIPNAGAVAQFVRAAELMIGLALILGLLTNFAALGSIILSAMILFSQGGVRFGTGLGTPEFLNINLLTALLSITILFSAAAKYSSADVNLVRRSPALSLLLTNRRSGGGSRGRRGGSRRH